MNKTNESQPNGLQKVFNFEPTNQPIRVEILDDEPWFVAKDVCSILAIQRANDAVRKLEDDEYLMRKIYASGQLREMLTVSESGLYALVVRSNKPEARRFRKWVTSEVLPQIRRNGHYGHNPETTRRLDTLEQGLTALMGAMTSLTNILAQGQSPSRPPQAQPNYTRLTPEVLDARHLPFDFKQLMGENIRHIVIEEKDWYSLNDVLVNMRVKTGSGQVARKLPDGTTAKIWLYGNTHPAWFCSRKGVDILMHGSRKLRNNGYFNQTNGGLSDGTI